MLHFVTGLEFAFWGAAGSFAVEGLELTTEVKTLGGWPWKEPDKPGLPASLISMIIRLVIGAIVASAAGVGGQVNGVFGALAAGVAAPLIIEKLGQTTVLTNQTRDATSASNAIPADTAGEGGNASV